MFFQFLVYACLLTCFLSIGDDEIGFIVHNFLSTLLDPSFGEVFWWVFYVTRLL
jgi:hypothetical protein